MRDRWLILHSGAPTGACYAGLFAIDQNSGNLWYCLSGAWHQSNAGGGGVPTGMILMTTASACPSGWTENDTFSGLYALGTTAALGGIGTTGGSTSYTPAGSVAAPSFTGSSGTVPAETVSWPTNVPTINEPSFTITGTKMTTSGSGTPAGTSFNGTTLANGSNSVTNPTQAISWPANPPTNGTVSFTPSGSNSAPGFTGTGATIQMPYEKVLFCTSP